MKRSWNATCSKFAKLNVYILIVVFLEKLMQEACHKAKKTDKTDSQNKRDQPHSLVPGRCIDTLN